MPIGKNIFLAGHKGMVGQGFYRNLSKSGDHNIITIDRDNLDLRKESHVENFFKKNKFDTVIIAAAKVGGIYANEKFPAMFIYDNLKIQTNLVHFSKKYEVGKVIFLSSCCIYPKNCKQPMNEDYILSGKLEPTNESYAIAKIAGISLCKSYYQQYGLNSFCPMPINLYGPYDNFDPLNSHIIAGLINRIHNAKIKNEETCTVWGSGKVKREFMHVDDCVKGILYVNELINDGSIINIAPGKELTTFETAENISEIIGYKGNLILDKSKPDGTPRKFADSSKIKNLGWIGPKVDFKKGLHDMYKWYLDNKFLEMKV